METKDNRFGDDTKLSKFGLEIRLRKEADETYPAVPRPATVDCKFPKLSVPLPTAPKAVEKEERAPWIEEFMDNVET